MTFSIKILSKFDVYEQIMKNETSFSLNFLNKLIILCTFCTKSCEETCQINIFWLQSLIFAFKYKFFYLNYIIESTSSIGVPFIFITFCENMLITFVFHITFQLFFNKENKFHDSKNSLFRRVFCIYFLWTNVPRAPLQFFPKIIYK